MKNIFNLKKKQMKNVVKFFILKKKKKKKQVKISTYDHYLANNFSTIL